MEKLIKHDKGFDIVAYGTKYYRKEKIASPVNSPMIVNGNKHQGESYDIKSVGQFWYRVRAVLDCVRILPTSIPLYKKMPWMDEYGFAIKCDSGEYFVYNHCVSNTKLGTRFKKGAVIGRMDTIERQRALRKKWGANPTAFTGRHLHEVFICTDGKTQLNFIKFLPIDTKIQNLSKPVKMDGYIYTWLKNYK